MGVNPDRNTEGPGQAKVCQLDHPLVVNQEVLGLQISVEDSTTVTKIDTLQNLVEVALKSEEGKKKT